MSAVEYRGQGTIPLAFTRVRGGVGVTGLTVTVAVLRISDGSTLLATTNVPELGQGLYQYQWTHGLVGDTQCLVIYTVGSNTYREFINISFGPTGGRGS